MANRPRTADLLRKFVELFVNGKLPKPLWNFLSTTIMIPFHKLTQVERDMLADPRQRPITIGTLLCRFSVRAVLRMHRKGIAERLLQSNKFSYGVAGGVQIVIMGCTIALQCNPEWCLLEIDFKNAHTDYSRGNI